MNRIKNWISKWRGDIIAAACQLNIHKCPQHRTPPSGG